ncbi:MAG TPA: NapC/NirT family cytochrome c [Acidobacteriota bacterium]|jgi:nitrate/TMAO reductase-like tetraheme cytochrome c subunit
MEKVRFCLIQAAFLVGHPVFAQTSQDQFHHDPVELYASKVFFWSLLIGIALVLFSLISVLRGHILGPLFKTLLVVSVVMVPLLAICTGMLLVFSRAERVEFCGTCHLTMKPYVEDMKNLKSEGLAAIHYRNQYIHNNQCYECHTSYGMFGTVEAKKDGIVDVYKYYTRTYKLPIKMRKPYPNGDCLKCHAQSVKWLSLAEHSGAQEELFSGRMSCQDCHGITHPAHPISQRL